MTSYPREYLAAQVRALEIEAETGITVRQQAEMPLDEWSRLAFGRTPAQAALQAIALQAETDAEPRSGAPASDSSSSNPMAPAPATVSGPPSGITDEEFLSWRNQRGNQGEGQGLFSGIGGSGSAEYQVAASRQSGRTAFGREQHHPGIPRQFSVDDQPWRSGRRTFYSGS